MFIALNRLPRSTSHAFIAGALALAASCTGAVTLSGPNLTIEFGDPTIGNPNNHDRVDRITWRSSTGEVLADWVTSGGSSGECNDRSEFFGGSRFGPDNVKNAPIGAGTYSQWVDGGTAAGVSKTRPRLSCESRLPPVAVTTRYLLPADSASANQMKVVRQWQFNSKSRMGLVYGLFTYIPRLPIQVFRTVLVPTLTGNIAYDAFGCLGDGCSPGDWLGNWYAIEDASGRGLMVIRDPGAATPMPAQLNIRFDPVSGSNASSIVIDRPAAGFKAPITETQTLCFYDAISWPAPLRGFQFPAGCGIR